MPAKAPKIPAYRLHKPTGQAVVRLNGHDHYLGKHGTEASHEAYNRRIAEWLTSGRQRRPEARPDGATSPLTVNQLILAYWRFAEKHYRHADGTPTKELANLRDALRPLRRLYGTTPARDVGPLAFRALQQAMVKDGLARKTVNARVNRLRRVFRWAASVELLPVAVPQALATVPPLQRGRCDAPESPGVRPVPWERVQATLPHLPAPVAAMVQVMRYSNCRAEDAVIMRGCDLVRGGDVWEYRPASHKNQWREESSPIHKRLVHLGPRCQAALQPFLDRPAEAYLFSPAESRAAYQARRAAQRKTKRTPSEQKRKKAANPKRSAGRRYTVNSFQQTIRRACRKQGVPVWTVLQIRHTRATEVREHYGLEGAAASLGDCLEAAQIYAEKNRLLAQKIAREQG